MRKQTKENFVHTAKSKLLCFNHQKLSTKHKSQQTVSNISFSGVGIFCCCRYNGRLCGCYCAATHKTQPVKQKICSLAKLVVVQIKQTHTHFINLSERERDRERKKYQQKRRRGKRQTNQSKFYDFVLYVCLFKSQSQFKWRAFKPILNMCVCVYIKMLSWIIINRLGIVSSVI